MPGPDKKTIVQRWYDNYYTEELIAENSVWRIAEGYPGGGIYYGRRAYFDDYFKGLQSHFDEWKAVPTELLEADDGRAVVGIGHYQGKVKGTGVRAEIPFLHIWWIENGQIVRVQASADTAVFARILKDDPVYQAQMRRAEAGVSTSEGAR